ncbi:hypothetical protein C8J56DRAFT_781566 [Mycena floridula]|nr:hypothetical protein C8J56DRAFT_781566 [Mycena floridula]
MPRLIPRLVKKFSENPSQLQDFSKFERRLRVKSSYKPVPPAPSLKVSDHPVSILLSSRNPITHSKDYLRHKTLPPVVKLRRGRRSLGGTENDAPREMTAEERTWWSNPYLRMIASPIRACAMTGAHLPSDFLLRIAAMRLPPTRMGSSKKSQPTILVPDGLESSKYRVRRSGKAVYVLCWHEAVHQLSERRIGQRIITVSVQHSLLKQQIRHLLRLRVIQELELVADTLERDLKHTPSDKPSLIRKLTRGELKEIKTSGVIPYDNALAVLIVPPLNRNPVSKQRPERSMSPGPPDEPESTPQRPPLPMSTLHSSQAESQDSDTETPFLSTPRIPLYNGTTLFPHRSQRAALHRSLSRLLAVERKLKYREGAVRNDSALLGGETKASHAFLLCCDSDIVQRGDIAAVAVALWRLRLFEGCGWEEPGGSDWYKAPKYRSLQQWKS